MIDHLLVGVLAFTQIALMSFNVLNVVKQRVVLAVLTSFGISAAWAYNITHVAQDPVKYFFAYAMGCALGTSLVIILDKRRKNA